MCRKLPSWRVLKFMLRQRAAMLLGKAIAPFADTPAGLDLSPSTRHFHDYDHAPLQLRFAGGAFQDAGTWQQVARSKLAELMGYEAPSQPVETLQQQSFPLPRGQVRQRFYIRIRPGVDLPVHVIAPATSASAPRPVMLCLQGTNTGAHNSWGEARFPADLEKQSGDYAIALQAAERGYVAVAVEQSCFGERTERQIRPRSAAPCVDASMHAFLLGRSLLGERCSDVSAVISWLQQQAGILAIDPARIYAVGHSAGGSVALFAAALDLRIQAVLACGCLGFIRDTIGRRRDDQGQNVVPGILRWMELGDVVGLVAPRPLVSVAGSDDPIWPAAGAAAVFAEAREIYARFDAANRLKLVAEPGGHRFRPEASWAGFQSALEADYRSGCER